MVDINGDFFAVVRLSQ